MQSLLSFIDKLITVASKNVSHFPNYNQPLHRSKPLPHLFAVLLGQRTVFDCQLAEPPQLLAHHVHHLKVQRIIQPNHRELLQAARAHRKQLDHRLLVHLEPDQLERGEIVQVIDTAPAGVFDC
uniref:(northern house mosquito) hypothetical protein n=1 Tax=Culex pipiens TaxID=7175 RepID=A0A8D8H5N5_CULPI